LRTSEKLLQEIRTTFLESKIYHAGFSCVCHGLYDSIACVHVGDVVRM